MKIFLTGISATPYAREYLSKFAATLREQGHAVFVPHENGWEAPANPWAQNRFAFATSVAALEESDWLVAVLDGYNLDDAVAVQVGMFYMLTKIGHRPRRMVGVLHDTRIAGWSWTAGDRTLCPQVRDAFRACGEVVPNFAKVQALIDAVKG
jgi:hypothetical protein